MMASLGTEYYQILLAQGVCSGIGVSAIFQPCTYSVYLCVRHLVPLGNRPSCHLRRRVVQSQAWRSFWNFVHGFQYWRRRLPYNGVTSYPRRRLRLGYAHLRIPHVLSPDHC